MALAAGAASGSRFCVSYLDAGGAARRESLPMCQGLRFEDAAPVRSFPSFKGQGNFTGLWWSSTTGSHVGYESWLERDNLMVLDFDPQVTGIASQPFWLHWPAGSRNRRHAPDYFARRADGTGVVIDVRADDRIGPEDAEAFAAMAAACAEAGWEFRRAGALDAVLAGNVRWLARYRHQRCGGHPDVARLLLGIFAEPGPLLAGARRAGETLMVLPVLYHLLWRQVLTADLRSAPLGPAAIVSAPGGAGR